MKNIALQALHKIALYYGYTVSPKNGQITKDMDPGFREILNFCIPYSMTSIERMYALYKAVEYVVKSKIPGDFVECGVWKGGSAMIIAKTLIMFGDTTRKIYLYDTFEGMPKPDERDIKIRTGINGVFTWNLKQKNGGWCNIPIDEVKQNLSKTKYPKQNIYFVAGMVEKTIPKNMPESIALLRLDTDWYTSTYHELVHLYPKLSRNGILIIDDYGSWSGARDATDTYFKEHAINIYLHRVDCGRFGIKTN